MNRLETIVLGSGIAGIAAAYCLSCRRRPGSILLVDRGPPMAYTTSQSGENYRDYWPQPCLADFSARSISLMEAIDRESEAGIGMRPFGYEFVSFSRDGEIFPASGAAGHAGRSRPEAITDRDGIFRSRPYLSQSVRQLTRIVRAGAVDVHALGSHMLSAARRSGVRLETAHVVSVSRDGERFRLETKAGGSLESSELLLAAGPMNPMLAKMLGVELAMESFLQRKIVIPDPLGVIPRDMPFTIFADRQFLGWSDEERELISAEPEYGYLLEEFPPGLHVKPEGRGIKLGWAYNRVPETPAWEPAGDLDFPNIVLRGAATFIPGLARYVEQPPTPVVQLAGYYTRTRENWPVIGPLEEVPGLYTIAALSGYGTMTACAAGELAAAWMTGGALPAYARHFHPKRREDPEILAEIRATASDGQL
jgi:glycine/D-amino acid oxidase-like deaminating enzyme